MNLDIGRINEQVNAFWGDYGYAVIATVGVLAFALVVVSAVKLGRSRQRDRWVAGLTALVVLAWTSEGLWEVARYTIGLAIGFAVMTFFVYEAMMLTAALQAERYRKHHPSPGPAGRFVWVLASSSATIVALNAATLVEALVRFSLPLTAAGLWWIGITAEREEDSEQVKRLREKQRAKRKATWAIDIRRPLVAIGVMRPAAQTLTEAERERRIRQMVAAAVQLHTAGPGSRRADRALQRLRRLAEMATRNDVAAVAARVERAVRIAELVIPAAAPPATLDRVPAHYRGNGHASHASSPAPGEEGDAAPEAEAYLLRETAPLHPDPPASISGNGAASVKHQPEAGASRDGGRDAAQRVYRDSVREGRPLSSRKVARIVGCSPSTAWRAIRTVKQTNTSSAASPNGPSPTTAGGTSTASASDAHLKA